MKKIVEHFINSLKTNGVFVGHCIEYEDYEQYPMAYKGDSKSLNVIIESVTAHDSNTNISSVGAKDLIVLINFESSVIKIVLSTQIFAIHVHYPNTSMCIDKPLKPMSKKTSTSKPNKVMPCTVPKGAMTRIRSLFATFDIIINNRTCADGNLRFCYNGTYDQLIQTMLLLSQYVEEEYYVNADGLPTLVYTDGTGNKLVTVIIVLNLFSGIIKLYATC